MSDLLLPVAAGLWALGISQADVARVGSYGLAPELPIVLYAGIALLVVSVTVELARAQQSTWRLACHATALVVMLYGIAPLVYPEGRYEWLYKTFGPVQYINAYGQLNHNIDIYQNWPGFFALAAWFGKVAGVASPLAYAKWAQLVFELAALPLLYLIYNALSLTRRQCWVAIFLYSASNWIGQDYFSPQALGTVLGLGIMAIALRWLYASNVTFRERERKPAKTRNPFSRLGDDWRVPSGHTWLIICSLLLCFYVLVFTHELSPYMLAIQLGMLAVVRQLRPRWLPLALAAIALAFYCQIVAVGTGWVVTAIGQNVLLSDEISGFFEIISYREIAATLVKSAIFGMLVAVVSGYHGLRNKTAMTEVPQAVSQAVIRSLLAVFVADGVVTVLVY